MPDQYYYDDGTATTTSQQRYSSGRYETPDPYIDPSSYYAQKPDEVVQANHHQKQQVEEPRTQQESAVDG
jgi:hypothetical protein